MDAPHTLSTSQPAAAHDGRVRAVIEGVRPELDCGRFPIKRVVGERVMVEADAFADGHDVLACVLRYRHEAESEWQERAMEPLGNDHWRGSFPVERLGRYRYTVTAWVDPFLSWRHDFARRCEPEDILVAARVGARLIGEAAERARAPQAQVLREWSERLAQATEAEEAQRIGLDQSLAGLAMHYPDQRWATDYDRELEVVVDRVRARFSAWYELFPRSTSPEPGHHGTFRDVEAWLPGLAQMGFDVLYLPPIHPIGRVRRKGKNNALVAAPDDVGSPWAIGAAEGGHKAVHPQLGTLADFRRLVKKAWEHGLEIAMDIAFQCAPDHPYVQEHPEWFRWRPDGTVQYAENPPKKYQDIYPFHFEGEDWESLWVELKSVFEFWMEQGVKIFRVDNPHTKPFAFWEWVIGQLKKANPELIFLSEAFTRPKVMHRLAKPEGQPPFRSTYVVVEKILKADERLPNDWPVHGTTGYDFMNQVGGALAGSRRWASAGSRLSGLHPGVRFLRRNPLSFEAAHHGYRAGRRAQCSCQSAQPHR